MAVPSDFLPRKRERDKLGEWHWQDEEFQAEFPILYALLAAARMDGVWRVGATITVFCDDGELKSVVRDRQTDQSLFLTLDPSKALWEQLEGFIRNHPGAWREKREDTSNRRRA